MKPWEQQRILVTGGAGFIGSALAWELNRRGARRIVIADHLGTSEKWRNLVPLQFEDYFEADAFYPRLLEGHHGAFDTVFHLGACSATTQLDAAYLVANNYECTKALARWSLERGARFAYASSAATYGDGERGMGDAEAATGGAELHRLRPLNMYGYSKHLFDLHAREMGWLPRIVGLKFFNVFGPNEDHKGGMRSVVHKSYHQVTEQGRIDLFKSHRPDYHHGEQRRDFLYVKDAVKIVLHLAANPQAGGLYNVGSGVAHTWNELARAIFHALGHEPRIEYIEMPPALQGKYQHFTQADIGKLRQAGYDEPPTPLGRAVHNYVAHYLVPDRRLGEETPEPLGGIE